MSAEVERKVQHAIDALNGLYGPVDKSKKYEILTGLVEDGMAIERKRVQQILERYKEAPGEEMEAY